MSMNIMGVILLDSGGRNTFYGESDYLWAFSDVFCFCFLVYGEGCD